MVESKVAKCTERHEQVYVSVLAKAVQYKHCLLPCYFLFLQALNFLVESFGLLNELFPFPSILDAGYPVFGLHLADVLCDVIFPSVLGFSL